MHNNNKRGVTYSPTAGRARKHRIVNKNESVMNVTPILIVRLEWSIVEDPRL